MSRNRKWWSVPLAIAGLHSCALAAYHFVLPFHMRWRSGLDGVPDSIVWALFALNFSWSLLVFLTGALVLRAAVLGPAHGFVKSTVFTIGLFWALHGAYTWANPLPLPASLQILKYVLAAFPALVVTLHWFPLILFARASDALQRYGGPAAAS
jgi:hypothetical protein